MYGVLTVTLVCSPRGSSQRASDGALDSRKDVVIKNDKDVFARVKRLQRIMRHAARARRGRRDR